MLMGTSLWGQHELYVSCDSSRLVKLVRVGRGSAAIIIYLGVNRQIEKAVNINTSKNTISRFSFHLHCAGARFVWHPLKLAVAQMHLEYNCWFICQAASYTGEQELRKNPTVFITIIIEKNGKHLHASWIQERSKIMPLGLPSTTSDMGGPEE